MGRQNIYETLSVASVMPTPMIQDLVDFLMRNRNFILPSDKRKDAFNTRFSGNSLLSDIVHRLTILGKDQAYSLIRFPVKTVALREAVDMTFIPIDLLQMKEMIPSSSKTLSLLPELDNRLLINITDITKANGDFSDATQFQYRVVRDFLSRSFYVSDGNVWLSPTLVRYVAKVYSMTIGGQIARLFNLSDLVRSYIQTVFCAFFVGRMTSDDIAVAFMKAHGRYMALPDASQITQILGFIQDTLKTKSVPTTLEEVCQVIDAYDHDQLKSHGGSRVTRPVLNTKFAHLFTESHVSIISLEYPPYFLFMIILALSGVRSTLCIHMKNMNLFKEGQEVMDQLVKSSTLFNSL